MPLDTCCRIGPRLNTTAPAYHAPESEIRKELRKWQLQHGGPNADELRAFQNHPAYRGTTNTLSRSNQPVSDESLQEHFEEDEEDLNTVELFLNPGDVAELRAHGREPFLAVYIQQIDAGRLQFYTVNGKWCHSPITLVHFVIPGFIDPALSEEAEVIYRENAGILDNAYSSLADKSRTRMMTLTKIAKALLGRNESSWEPSSAARLAVRKALLHNEFRFRSDYRSQRLTQVFAIRPKTEVQIIENVQEWVRQYLEFEADRVSGKKIDYENGPLYVSQFIEKARRLIAHSRGLREPMDGYIGPSKSPSTEMSVTWGETFSITDKQIIAFLQAWSLFQQFRKMDSMAASCAAIVQATGCYEEYTKYGYWPEKMDSHTGMLLLQEIGVVTPHDNSTIYDESLMLPTVRSSRNLELLNTKAELTRTQPDFRDSMATLRRDWGPLPVYCIDSPGAKEIDDGLSVEKVEGTDTEYWLHVHIANPTAFFGKAHVLSGLAAHMTESVYLPEMSYPMLPSWVSQNYFSLDRDRPVLTFSTRVSLDGNVLETKIQSGIIREVVNLTQVEVAEMLGENPRSLVTRFLVGGEVPDAENRPSNQLPDDQVQDLRDLYAVARALWARRKAGGGLRMDNQNKEIRVFTQSGKGPLGWSPPSMDTARFIHGDPIIEFSTTRREQKQDITAVNITEEAMLLACNTAAAWCAERGIPVMFRGTVGMPGAGMTPSEFKEKIVKPYLDRGESLNPALVHQYSAALGRSITHFSPIPHEVIGVDCYTKVTSPLRRFTDMIAHWQIEAALRHEAQTGEKFNYSSMPNPSSLPFSKRQMQDSIIALGPKEKVIAYTKRKAVNFWAAHAFARAFYFKEAELPETINVYTVNLKEGADIWDGIWNDMGIRILVRREPDVKLRIGDLWEVKIVHVGITNSEIVAEAVRLVEAAPEMDQF
ncbi:hypothetical protein BCR34DRAFT_607518 [Clohesyomyces aquaticus]|uniref:RNB domain-containing protein n=1 Tax=Clohesyomyces aquaticus TaxID=1231657 RepID=A0A1Y1YGN3_9PLEO|nr:hypothetical protein BCR34DRAFT_607518 [Clohesyomyces aquaticus]